MANLNFTRNIGGNSLGRSSVSFGSNSMSGGHVTPVFGRAPSERRTLPTMGYAIKKISFVLFFHRNQHYMFTLNYFSITRSSNQMSNMNSLGGYSSFNSVFGSGDTNTPSLLDLSEFPSLTNRNAGDNVPQPSPMPGAKPYVGMVKQPTSESSEFTMSSEDFPALPGTQNRDGASPGSGASTDKGTIGTGGDGNTTSRENEKNNSKTGIFWAHLRNSAHFTQID